MLTIRRAQFDALGEEMARRFESEMVGHLAQRFPAAHERLQDAGTRRLVRAGIAKGRAHGIDAVRDVATLVELMCEFGEDFDSLSGRESVHALLNRRDHSAQARMDMIHLAMTDRLRNN